MKHKSWSIAAKRTKIATVSMTLSLVMRQVTGRQPMSNMYPLYQKGHTKSSKAVSSAWDRCYTLYDSSLVTAVFVCARRNKVSVTLHGFLTGFLLIMPRPYPEQAETGMT